MGDDAGCRIEGLLSISKPPNGQTGITGITGSTGSTDWIQDAGFRMQDGRS